MTTFTFHCDPGHGWLMVNAADIRSVGLTPDAFSAYSYREKSGRYFYLEEDCDATKFLEAWRQVHGAYPPIREHHVNHNSPIRALPHIRRGRPRLR